MAHRGSVIFNDTLLSLVSPEFITHLDSFLSRGYDVVRQKAIRYQTNQHHTVFTLNHPDFTEPDGTEYILVITRTPAQQEYIYALQACLPVRIKQSRPTRIPMYNLTSTIDEISDDDLYESKRTKTTPSNATQLRHIINYFPQCLLTQL